MADFPSFDAKGSLDELRATLDEAVQAIEGATTSTDSTAETGGAKRQTPPGATQESGTDVPYLGIAGAVGAVAVAVGWGWYYA